MSLIVEDRRISGQLTGAGDQTDFSADLQSLIVTIEIDVRTETYLLGRSLFASELPLWFIQCNAESKHTGKVQDNRAINTNNPDGWIDFNVGDTFVTVDLTKNGGENNKSGTIIEISEDGQTLITDQTFSQEVFPIGAYIGITTPITAITHRHGLIENAEPANFLSKVDGSEQIAQLGGASSTNLVFQDAILLGNKSWQSGFIKIKGNGIGNGDPTLSAGIVQAFTIQHEFIINPLMLFDEFDDIINDIKPDRLLDSASLRYVFSVDASPVLKNPNDVTNVVFDEIIGNIGWFNENFNGGPSDYSFQDVVYKNLADEIKSGLELTDNETKLFFTIISVKGTFSDTDTQMVFGYNFAPGDQEQYRNNALAISQTMEFNFMYDNVLTTLGEVTGVPRKLGTTTQIIKSMTATFVSPTRIDVEVRIDLATEIVSRLAASTDKRFMIWFATADHTLDRANSDAVNLKIDSDVFFVDFSDPGMITMDQNFLTHPFANIETELASLVDGFLEDDIVGVNDFFLDKNTREEDDIIFLSIIGQVIARKNTGASFVLDSFTRSLTGSTIINDATFGGVPDTNFSTPRGFKTPADINRANVILLRNYDEDALGLFHYRLQFPFIIRWEDYIALSGVNDEFFDNTEPNNGLNQDWNRYDLNPDWDIFFQTILTAQKNGNPLTFPSLKLIDTLDYTEGPEWNTEVINFFDENDDPLVDGGTKFIIKFDDTKVEANFTYIGSAPPPVVGDLVIVLKIYVFEQGTFKSSYWLSSAYDAHPDTWWKSIDSSNRVIVTDEGSSVFRGAALLQGNLLSSDQQFRVTAKLYDKRDAVPIGDAKLLEDGSFKLLENGRFKLID